MIMIQKGPGDVAVVGPEGGLAIAVVPTTAPADFTNRPIIMLAEGMTFVVQCWSAVRVDTPRTWNIFHALYNNII